MREKFLFGSAVLLLTFLAAPSSLATIAEWTGDLDLNVWEPYNWTAQAEPETDGRLTIGQGSYYSAVFDVNSGTRNAGMFTITAGGMLTVAGGVLNLRGITDTSLRVLNGSAEVAGVLITGGEVNCDKNLYVGRGYTPGCVTIMGGKLTCAQTTTLGFWAGEASVGGRLNIWGGEVDLGRWLRMHPSIGLRHGGGRGVIDIRGTGVAVVDEPWDWDVNDLIRHGCIVSEAGYVPVVEPFWDAGLERMRVRIHAQQIYYATGPSPVAAGTHQAYSTEQALSWVKPLPRIPGDTVTSDVYFGTNPTPTTLIDNNIQGSSITLALPTDPEQTYYWKVDSRDSNGGFPFVTPGDVWSFDTCVAPVVTVGTGGRQAVLWQTALGHAETVLQATATDDGYPSPMTYTWECTGAPSDADVVVSDANVFNPVVTMDKLGYYSFVLTANDGARESSRELVLRVFAEDETCIASQFLPDFEFISGDVNRDCVVDMADVAIMAGQWLESYNSFQ